MMITGGYNFFISLQREIIIILTTNIMYGTIFLYGTQILTISQIWEDLVTDVSDGLTVLSPCEQAPRHKPLISSALITEANKSSR